MKELMLGNEAIAQGAYEAGVTVATAYPGPLVRRLLRPSAVTRRSAASGRPMKRSPWKWPPVQRSGGRGQFAP